MYNEIKMIPQMQPWIGEEEKQAVTKYLDSGGWLTEYQHTREFEQAIADYVGSQYASVVCNGTASLFIALMALGIGPGDEVIVPDFTMIASANAVMLAGATPVLVDIDRATLCLDLELAEQAITPRTKAIMLVSLNGRAPNMEWAMALAHERGLFLVEDAAQAMGSGWRGRHLGTFGHVGSFSFSAPKIITTGQGGALVTDDANLIEAIRKIKDWGRAQSGVDEHVTLGYNFKFTDLQAVIGLAQMEKLEWRAQRKKEMFVLYQRELTSVPEIQWVATNLDDTAPWFIDILVPDPLALRDYLKERGVGTRPFYPPVHTQAPYYLEASYPSAEYVSCHGLWLPSASFLDDVTIKGVCATIRGFYG